MQIYQSSLKFVQCKIKALHKAYVLKWLQTWLHEELSCCKYLHQCINLARALKFRNDSALARNVCFISSLGVS